MDADKVILGAAGYIFGSMCVGVGTWGASKVDLVNLSTYVQGEFYCFHGFWEDHHFSPKKA